MEKQMDEAQVRQIKIQLEMERIEQLKKKKEERSQMHSMMQACEQMKHRKYAD
jgi:hypothetical protein